MTPGKTALVSCMRNEGLFVLEWIAYQQSLDFAAIGTPEQRRARTRKAA